MQILQNAKLKHEVYENVIILSTVVTINICICIHFLWGMVVCLVGKVFREFR